MVSEELRNTSLQLLWIYYAPVARSNLVLSSLWTNMFILKFQSKRNNPFLVAVRVWNWLRSAKIQILLQTKENSLKFPVLHLYQHLQASQQFSIYFSNAVSMRSNSSTGPHTHLPTQCKVERIKWRDEHRNLLFTCEAVHVDSSCSLCWVYYWWDQVLSQEWVLSTQNQMPFRVSQTLQGASLILILVWGSQIIFFPTHFEDISN